ncbi:MAG: hypothetical protein ACFFD9_09325 [Candidatus Thorarchaeota archaeon]
MRNLDSGEGNQLEVASSDEQLSDYTPRTNEKFLFIMHKESGMAMYSHAFVSDAFDPPLISGFIGAMGSFLTEFIGSEESRWKTVYGSDTTLIVEGGEWAVAVLAVSRETSDMRSKLAIIVAEFEATYGVFRNAKGFEGSLLGEFDKFVMGVFVGDRLTSKSKFRRRLDWQDARMIPESSKQSFLTRKLLDLADGQMDVQKLTDNLGISTREAQELVSEAFWQNMIELDYAPLNNDVLIRTEKSLSVLFSQANPLKISTFSLMVIGALDGYRSIESLTEGLDESQKIRVLSELGHLMGLGYIQKTTPEHRIVLSNIQLLNRFLYECAQLTSETRVSEILESAMAGGVKLHPWISRIRVLDGLHLACLIDENRSPVDLNDIHDAILHLLNSTYRLLCEHMPEDRLRAVLADVRRSLHTGR